MLFLFNNFSNKKFVSSWKTNNAGSSASDQITIPTISTGSYNCIVDWGDGTSSTITTYNDDAWTHTYPSSGTYTVRISGIFTGIRFNNSGDRLKLLNISRWGNFKFGTNQGEYFYGCANLTITASDIPNTSATTVFRGAFRSCTVLTSIPIINSWNMLAVTSLNTMFSTCPAFNQALTLNVPALTDCSNMFQACTGLNSAITLTTSTSLTTVSNMFFGCTSLNSLITISNTQNVTSFGGHLSGCTVFNQPVSYNTQSALSFNGFFQNSTAFDQDISAFDIRSLTSGTSMMSGSAFSKTNYNKLLDIDTGWPSQATINNSVTISFGTAHYDGADAIAGRAVLAITHSWTITDGGTP